MLATAGAFVPEDDRQGRGFERHHHQPLALGIWRNPQMIETLKLTRAQVEQLRSLDFAHREKELPLKAQIESCHLNMDKAISRDSVDKKEVLSLANKMAELKRKKCVHNIESRLALREILTADQLNEFKSLFAHQKRRGPQAGRKCLPECHPQGERGPGKAAAF